MDDFIRLLLAILIFVAVIYLKIKHNRRIREERERNIEEENLKIKRK